MTVDLNTAVALSMMGHNNPPEPTPFDLSKQEAEDLLLEARNWADGTAITTQQQADECAGLLAMLKAAAKRADDRRKEEARPHDEAKAEIQSRYNTLIGDTKGSGKGKLVIAEEAIKATLSPWLKRIDDEKRAAAEKLRQEQLAKQAEAEAAFRKAREANDLEAKEEAEHLAVEAAKAAKIANKADKATTVGTGLRTVVVAEVTDMQALARWLWKHDSAALAAYMTGRASELVKAGQRNLDGVTVSEIKEVR